MNPSRSGRKRGVELRLRLYVAGSAPNSAAAVANLRRALGAAHCTIEIVDVLKSPARALEDRIIVTPTLVRIEPSPPIRIVGDLSDDIALSAMLGLEGVQS